jgi:hypothetical protein
LFGGGDGCICGGAEVALMSLVVVSVVAVDVAAVGAVVPDP